MLRPLRTHSILVLTAVLLSPAAGAGADSPHAAHPAGDRYGEELGSVELPVSCAPEAASVVARGLALLHHMTYEGARELFAAATAADPECAMGYWGQAMTFIHPLWSDPPAEADFERGRSLAETAATRGEATERERAYAAAVGAYYAEGRGRDERPNLAAFERGWQMVHERFPDDPEAAAFYALAHLGTADPSDKSYAHQRRAGAIAEGILERIPNHPGGHHYTIHAYDYPPLAGDALAVARHYGEIAPAVPHALHMPTHIFTRLGLWQESIAWNERSAAAAHEHPVDGKVSLHHLHALDYLAYAHLQRGEDGKAEEVARAIDELEGPFMVELATPYTLTAVPARLALERRRWSEAAALEPRTPSDYPWDRFPAIEAITHFARALGAARTGQPAKARESVERLAALRDRAAETSAYWAQQVEIQRLAADAWLALAEDRKEAALETMRAAAELEAATEKHPVTPGEVLPARELLADLLLELDRPEEALAAYEAALERSPGRFNGLYGAGRAAELLGREETAKGYYQELVDLAPEGATRREPLAHARRYLAGPESPAR